MKVISFKNRDQGFVSIFSVLIIMGILTLVAIGFSNLTRDAQKRTLDSQLNTQAFYAAESGVNDAKKVLATRPAYTKATCQGGLPTDFSYIVDASLSVGYSCLLVNPASDIVLDTVSSEGASAPKTSTIETTSPRPFGKFDISWNGPGKIPATLPSPRAADYPNILDTTGTWVRKLGMLRVDLTPIDASLDRQTLVNNSYGFYLYPSSTAPPGILFVLNGTSAQAGLLFVKCTGGSTAFVSPCKATVTLGGASAFKFFIRVQALYNPVSEVTINNFKDISGGSLTTKSGQVVIDATGKANNVLRRIQVRVPQAGADSFTSSFAIQSGDTICKQMLVGPPDNVTDTTTNTPAEPACRLDN